MALKNLKISIFVLTFFVLSSISWGEKIAFISPYESKINNSIHSAIEKRLKKKKRSTVELKKFVVDAYSTDLSFQEAVAQFLPLVLIVEGSARESCEAFSYFKMIHINNSGSKIVDSKESLWKTINTGIDPEDSLTAFKKKFSKIKKIGAFYQRGTTVDIKELEKRAERHKVKLELQEVSGDSFPYSQFRKMIKTGIEAFWLLDCNFYDKTNIDYLKSKAEAKKIKLFSSALNHAEYGIKNIFAMKKEQIAKEVVSKL